MDNAKLALSLIMLLAVGASRLPARDAGEGEIARLIRQVDDSLAKLAELQTSRQVDEALARLKQIQQLRRQDSTPVDPKTRLVDLLFAAYAGDDGRLTPQELDAVFDDLTEIAKELRDDPTKGSNAAKAKKDPVKAPPQPARPETAQPELRNSAPQAPTDTDASTT